MNSQEKFTQIYIQYRRLMLCAALDILKNRQDSEDAVQDAFIRVSENIDNIVEVDSPRTRSFVMVITRNICLNILRRKRFESGADIDELNAVSDHSVEKQVFSDFGVAELESALKRLPADLRDILYLTVYEELSLKDASRLLGITYEAAKSRVRRARKKLAEIIEKGDHNGK